MILNYVKRTACKTSAKNTEYLYLTKKETKKSRRVGRRLSTIKCCRSNHNTQEKTIPIN